jgi:hypothetical protein
MDTVNIIILKNTTGILCYNSTNYEAPQYVVCRISINISIMVFWIVTPCSVAGGCRYFGGTITYILNPEDGADLFLRNVSSHLQDYTTSQL